MSNEIQSPVVPLLVSVRDAAKLLGISEKTIRNQCSAGTFPLSTVKIGGRQLFRMLDITELVYGRQDVRSVLRSATLPVATPQVRRGRGRPRKAVSLQMGGAA